MMHSKEFWKTIEEMFGTSMESERQDFEKRWEMEKKGTLKPVL